MKTEIEWFKVEDVLPEWPVTLLISGPCIRSKANYVEFGVYSAQNECFYSISALQRKVVFWAYIPEPPSIEEVRFENNRL